jgi:hypothetical protein
MQYTESPLQTGSPLVLDNDSAVDFSPANVESCATHAEPPLALSSGPQPNDHDAGTKRHRSTSAASSCEPNDVHTEDLPVATVPSPEEPGSIAWPNPTTPLPNGRREAGGNMLPARPSHKCRRVVDEAAQGAHKQGVYSQSWLT